MILYNFSFFIFSIKVIGASRDVKYNIVKVKELTKNKRKEGQYVKLKAKENRPLVETTKSHSHICDHSTNRRDTSTLI